MYMRHDSSPLPPLDPMQRYTVDESCRYLRTSRTTLYGETMRCD